MSTTAVSPKTILGIKRLATSIKRELQIPHTKALDVAAKRAGYTNFRNAQNRIGASGRSPLTPGCNSDTYPIWITAYWRDREYRTGRETLRISARQQWIQVLKRSEIASSRGLQKFRADAADHLETIRDLADQGSARRAVCEAARTLQFMEVTGLRPLTGHVNRLTKWADRLPRRDHATAWRDPDTQTVVVVDEPYSAAPDQMLTDRSSWAQTACAAIGFTSWPGMYYPGAAAMFLAIGGGRVDILQRLSSVLDSAADPVDADNWTGESASYTPAFLSPARVAIGRNKRARAKPIYRGLVRRNAVAYGHSSMGGAWRPNSRMRLDGHREVGNLLKELLGEGRFRSRACSRLEHVRSELDEWVQCEYPSERDLPSDHFSNLYYHAFERSGYQPRDAISRIAELLSANYPDCVPRRDLLRCLTAARKDLDR